MKKCSSCQNLYPTDSFALQKTNPNKRYAWCNGCRNGNVASCRPISMEYNTLREKAASMRALNDAQIAEARKLRAEGMTYAKIADTIGCTKGVASKWARLP